MNCHFEGVKRIDPVCEGVLTNLTLCARGGVKQIDAVRDGSLLTPKDLLKYIYIYGVQRVRGGAARSGHAHGGRMLYTPWSVSTHNVKTLCSGMNSLIGAF
jgi:hypothetical protein